MAAQNFTALLGQVLPFFMGAPEPVVQNAFIHAARELCKRSKCWNEWQDITLIAGQSDYSLMSIAMSSVRLVRAVMIPPRKPMTPITNEEIIRNRPYLLDAVGEPTAYVLDNNMNIRMYPQPTTAQDGLVAKVRLSFIPNTDSTYLPPFLIERFEETLVAGCKYLVMEIPGQQWSNPQQAAYYKTIFEKGVTEAEIELLTDYGSADLVVQKRRLGW